MAQPSSDVDGVAGLLLDLPQQPGEEEAEKSRA